MSFRLGTRESQGGPRGWRTSSALQPGGLFLAVAAVSTTVLKSEGQGEGGGRERGAQQAEGEHGHTTQPTAALWQGWARPPPSCVQESYVEARGWRGPRTAENSPGDSAPGRQTGEAVRKLSSRDCSHPGTQLSASTDARPRSGLSWPRKQLKPFLLKWESEHGAMPNPSQFLNPSVRLGHPRGVKETSPSPLGAELPAVAVQGQLWLKLRARPPPQRQQEQGCWISGSGGS